MPRFPALLGLFLALPAAFAAPALLPIGYRVQLDVVSEGFDGKTCWFHPRAGAIPGPTPIVVLTMQAGKRRGQGATCNRPRGREAASAPPTSLDGCTLRPDPFAATPDRRRADLAARGGDFHRPKGASEREPCRGKRWCGRTESNRRDLLGRQEFYH